MNSQARLRRLSGRSALISGGVGGRGGEASPLFAAEGAKVAVVDRQEEAGLALVEEIRAAGGEAVFAKADVSKCAEIESAGALATERFGVPTVLFNHAGSIVVKPFLETSDDDYDWLMNTNVRSMFQMTRAVLPGMLAAGGGAIVNTSSISAVAAP